MATKTVLICDQCGTVVEDRADGFTVSITPQDSGVSTKREAEVCASCAATTAETVHAEERAKRGRRASTPAEAEPVPA